MTPFYPIHSTPFLYTRVFGGNLSLLLVYYLELMFYSTKNRDYRMRSPVSFPRPEITHLPNLSSYD